MEWMAESNRLLTAGREADAVVERLGLSAPVDPLAIVRSEKPFLRAGGSDFGNRYDGMLEYHRSKNRFLLFYNTKYDVAALPGTHHPRTRFSIGHELGHYFLERHRAYLMKFGRAHPSKGEFRSDLIVEKEADSFAASILLPTKLARPMINSAELSVKRISDIAGRFNASFVCTTFRSVALSDFPCAVAGIRGGEVAWMFPSDALIKAGIYPNKPFLPANAREPWAEFQVGVANQSENEGRVREWFKVYDKEDLNRVHVTEEYIPVTSTGTLLVLLTMDESDVFPEDEEEHEDGD
jgi:IrrE N-terminal-like domain